MPASFKELWSVTPPHLQRHGKLKNKILLILSIYYSNKKKLMYTI